MKCDFEDPEARWHHQQEKGFFNLKNLFIIFIIIIIITTITTFICVFRCGHVCDNIHMEIRGSFVKSVLSFYLYMGSRYQTQILRLM